MISEVVLGAKWGGFATISEVRRGAGFRYRSISEVQWGYPPAQYLVDTNFRKFSIVPTLHPNIVLSY